MRTAPQTFDFVVVGAGIVGLALARELRLRQRRARIVVFEKESTVGKHASGRNSGVLHSGIYYSAGSLKAKICAKGARELGAYCTEFGLPIARCGKVIVPAANGDDATLDLLLERGRANGARVEVVDEPGLKQIEPEARSATGRALYSPDTAVIEPVAMLQHLQRTLADARVQVVFGYRAQVIDAERGRLRAGDMDIGFGHLFNAAGLDADRVAHACGVGGRYVLMPFKGLYYRLLPESELRIRGLIYPVPNLGVPFLGIHFTRGVDGGVHVGPTAVPALGRENYAGLQGIHAIEAATIVARLVGQYVRDIDGFRHFAHQEAGRLFKSRFVAEARGMVPRVRQEHLRRSAKLGIRAQLLDRETHVLVMDFVIEQGPRSTHVLNAVSPAFTSAFPFARMVLDAAGVN